jgi:hypothetical protein
MSSCGKGNLSNDEWWMMNDEFYKQLHCGEMYAVWSTMYVVSYIVRQTAYISEKGTPQYKAHF